MEDRIRERFSLEILDQVCRAFDVKFEEIKELDGFESYIYQFSRGDQKGILRISHSIRRTPELIQAELEWIDYLHLGGVSVARPLQTQQGSWLEVVDDGQGGSFLAAAFDWADGRMFKEKIWPDQILEQYGSQLGRMHKLATEYSPSDPAVRRAEWYDPLNLDYERFIPENDLKIKQVSRDLMAHFHSLPTTKDAYGMIHQDPHPGNFHVDQAGKITFFDFDDCAYGWFVNDIALVLFYTAMGKDPATFIPAFLPPFLRGYYREFYLDPRWFKEIPAFQKLRELDLYALIHRSFNVENLDDPWCSWYMDGRKERLEAGVPYLDFDFSGLNLEDLQTP